jgi:holliday junction DNA helicase RuvA
MIASLRGKIIHRRINRVIVEVAGVGYEAWVSLSTLEKLPDQGEVFLHIYTSVRENSLELFGFASQQEKNIFEMLLTVAGIGPKSALTVLSGVSPEVFRRAVLDSDTKRLTTIPGIGKKSAERIVVELREKIKRLEPEAGTGESIDAETSLEYDLVSSLMNLGYKERVAQETSRMILKQAGPGIQPAAAIKMALKELMK